MQLAGWVVAAIKECRPDRMYIDEIGVGAGVVDRLREQGYSVRGINVARRARHEGLFTNTRAEGYWRLRELFASGQIKIIVGPRPQHGAHEPGRFSWVPGFRLSVDGESERSPEGFGTRGG